ncbi:MAG: MerC domain-containing protein [Pseudomonadota bacterium]
MTHNRNIQEKTTDLAAISISSLCLMHCLLVPLAAAILPVFAAIEEAEWLHRLLVILSAPLSAIAIIQMRKHYIGPVFITAALFGLAMLFAAAFMERFHPQENVMTFIGAASLIFAHMWRWRSHGGASYGHRSK